MRFSSYENHKNISILRKHLSLNNLCVDAKMIQGHQIRFLQAFYIQKRCQANCNLNKFINLNHQNNQVGRQMLRRNLQFPLPQIQSLMPKKPFYSSVSTSGSSSPRIQQPSNNCKSSIRKDKEKSQLCKKYLEFGFCPYEKKCKFAHGSHELRKNQMPNSKYKTKVCGVYLQKGYCMFGQRCNFIHKHAQCTGQKVGDSGWQMFRAEIRSQSRLLSILKLA